MHSRDRDARQRRRGRFRLNRRRAVGRQGAPHLRGIYGIVDAASTGDPVRLVRALLDGGIAVVQYRSKAGVDPHIVRTLHAVTCERGASLIVNDDVEAALVADGLHVGQEDIALLDMRALRARLGERLLGISCGRAAEVAAAEAFGADYIGTGPFAITRSKADAGPPISSAGLAAVAAVATIPVVAIGGITLENLAEVRGTGAAMAAVLSALATAADPMTVAAAFVAAWG